MYTYTDSTKQECYLDMIVMLRVVVLASTSQMISSLTTSSLAEV